MKQSKKPRIPKTGAAPVKRNSSKEDITISEDFKKQLLGFLIGVFGIMICLSILSYSDKDQATLERMSFLNIFKKESYSSAFVTYNWLGIAGAYLSDFLVNYFFGYFSLIISVILITFGITLLFKKPLNRTVQFSIYASLLMMMTASFFGLLRIFTGPQFISTKMSGTTGDYFASIFYHTLGSVGSTVFFSISIILLGFLLVDGNIIKTLVRFKLFFENVFDKFKREKEDLVTQKELKSNKIKNNIPDDVPVDDADFEIALKKERERILKNKYSKTVNENELIKETEIYRPKQDDPSSIVIKPKKTQELSQPVLINAAGAQEIKNEMDVNPQNSNDVQNLQSKKEEDFKEEKLENYKYPTLELLQEPTKEEFEVIPNEELTENGRLLQAKLLKFGIEVEKVFATPGPVVTLYELVPAADVKLSKIESLQDDIALAMKAKGIRMIIPIPGKGTVGVEIPNKKAQLVRIRSSFVSQKFNDSKKQLPVAFGKTIDGEVFIDDLAKMPHLLIAGATGSGKSVGINTIIASLLYKLHPSDLKFVMIDPKKIELSLYSKLKKHFLATSGDINESIITSPANAVSVLKSVEREMENRYDKLANAGVRNIEAYNEKYANGNLTDNEVIRHKKMPYIVVIIDELADLMITAKREIEEPIARIAQMARAVGIHLIVATQRPSVDVITGVIKANFPVRIAYQVASKIDSRTILDMGGADQLLRNGDMLYLSSASSKPIRIQNAYITTEECEKLAEFIEAQEGFSKPYLLPSIIERKSITYGSEEDRDELFGEAAKLIFKLQQCSASTLQRRLRLGYARAARIVDQLEEAGIVGPKDGSNARDVLITTEDELMEYL
ncbi:MAG TPA: DNA translocase FtsK [Ignavibacteria bacterium]|nr:DNA translocase FtsK [Ignavibacteria bacterium]HQY52320.1 DNA translocase FtsK [Ignavibacteria bacterium]HRA99476.1 DNA translocase FtsK [Ignavibacteria bacterium]